MKIGMLIVGLLLFSVMMVGGAYIYSDAKNTYDFPTSEVGDEGFQVFEKTTNLTSDINTNFNGANAASTDPVTAIIAGGYSTIKVLFNSVGIIGQVMTNAAAMIHLPDFIVKHIMLIISMMVILSVLAAIMRWPFL